jgi:TPR repeat protein
MLYAYGMGVRVDYALARMLWEKAAAASNTEAMVYLGWMYSTGRGVVQDYGVAREWYEKAAAAGHSGAMNSLGQFHDYGCGVAEDHDEARRWYEKAGNSGDSTIAKLAKANLALLDQPDRHRARIAVARGYGCGATAPASGQMPSSNSLPSSDRAPSLQ